MFGHHHAPIASLSPDERAQLEAHATERAIAMLHNIRRIARSASGHTGNSLGIGHAAEVSGAMEPMMLLPLAHQLFREALDELMREHAPEPASYPDALLPPGLVADDLGALCELYAAALRDGDPSEVVDMRRGELLEACVKRAEASPMFHIAMRPNPNRRRPSAP